MGLLQFRFFCLSVFLVFQTSIAGSQYIGQIHPGFQASQMDWIEEEGLFWLSKNSTFGCGFSNALDAQSYLLVVIHLKSSKVVWTANGDLSVSDSDNFVFEKNGNVYLQHGDDAAWSTGTEGERVTSMKLMDSGISILLQSFSYPTDTLLPGQEFVEGMRLKSLPNKNYLNNYLEIKSGDLILYAGYRTPQVYWFLANESRKIKNSVIGKVHSATLISNSWNFYDQNRVLLWQFILSDNSDPNAMWAMVLGSDAAIGFYNLQKGNSVNLEATKIPKNSCSITEPCDRCHVCYFGPFCNFRLKKKN